MTEPAGVRIGAVAARVLILELIRRPSPKSALVVGAAPDSPVLVAARAALRPDDTLTALPSGELSRADALSGGGADRRGAETPDLARPADVVVLAEPMTGTAEQTRATVEQLAKLLTPGGMVVAAAIAVPGVAAGAAGELDRQAMLYGVGSDLVLRNAPPLRVHRLSWTAPDPAVADRLTPVTRPSSVRLGPDLRVDSHGMAAAGIGLGLAALLKLTRPRSRLWLLPAAAAVPLVGFFRDPERQTPAEESLVVAASDGRIISVERLTDEHLGGDYLRIAAYLSLLDIHINRAPVAGRVVDFFFEDGGYAAAMTPDAEHNLAAYTILQTTRGRVVVAQRTGVLARRIVHRAPVGALLARGERFGLIRFGSRTDVYLPAGAAEPLVAPDDRVIGGLTPIARWR